MPARASQSKAANARTTNKATTGSRTTGKQEPTGQVAQARKRQQAAAAPPKGNTTSRRKGVAPFPFREVTLITETYLDVKGVANDLDLMSCPRCAALLPSGEKAESAHRSFHEQIDGLDQR